MLENKSKEDLMQFCRVLVKFHKEIWSPYLKRDLH